MASDMMWNQAPVNGSVAGATPYNRGNGAFCAAGARQRRKRTSKPPVRDQSKSKISLRKLLRFLYLGLRYSP